MKKLLLIATLCVMGFLLGGGNPLGVYGSEDDIQQVQNTGPRRDLPVQTSWRSW
jgi:glutamate-1-semialdehyde aminotransferase